MSLRFWIGLRRYDTIVADAQEAESQGFAFASIGEHVFFHGPIGNGLIALAAAAGATTKIRLLSAITLVPLYPAALLAKQVATLDVVSGGRFDLGVGVGGEYEPEFIACGVKRSQRGARTDEALEVMSRLFTEDDVRFEGRFTELTGVTLAPKPVQRGGPPVWVSGRSEAAMRRCARYGDFWLPYMYTPERLSSSLETIGTFAADAGREGAVEPAIFLFYAVHEDRETAIRMASDQLSAQYNQDFSGLVGKYALAGNPDDCIARLREYVDAGASTVILNAACPTDYMADNQALLAKTVLPAFAAER
ncbi:MAG: LLM class F420-dependent oxidoreductase [Gammaproteobacteria bacterium]|nr:LLM class F420-dependent oxidoreductase [Gammaproteobacteria bacterium]